MAATSGTVSSRSTGCCWPATTLTSVMALANRNHLSCWRSTPRARRNRTASAATLASPSSAVSSKVVSRSLAGHPPRGASASWSTRADPRKGHSRAASSPGYSRVTRADSQATGRQRRDGRWPSGKSSSTKVSSSAPPGAQVHWPSQMASGPPGTVPGAVHSAYLPYMVPKVTRPPPKSPTAQKIHPSGLPGRWVAIRAPTIGNDNANTAMGPMSVSNPSSAG
jgi:hypothetical protein